MYWGEKLVRANSEWHTGCAWHEAGRQRDKAIVFHDHRHMSIPSKAIGAVVNEKKVLGVCEQGDGDIGTVQRRWYYLLNSYTKDLRPGPFFTKPNEAVFDTREMNLYWYLPSIGHRVGESVAEFGQLGIYCKHGMGGSSYVRDGHSSVLLDLFKDGPTVVQIAQLAMVPSENCPELP